MYHYLCQHPQIYMSSVKEPYFFSYSEKEEYSKGPGDQFRMKDAVDNIHDYEKLFLGAQQYIARGEASTTYLDSVFAPELIKHHVPESKIIVILRNPVERAYASFTHLRRDGCEPYADFARALQEEDKRISRKWSPLFHYKKRQFTFEKLNRYFSAFDSSKMRVYLYDDWKNDNHMILRDIFRFLGVDDNFSPDTSTKVNVGVLPKNESIHNFFVNKSAIKSTLKRLIPVKFRSNIKRNLMNLNFEKRPLPADIRKELICAYREDVLKVQELINRDLSPWLI
jgi:hypothetical protein